MLEIAVDASAWGPGGTVPAASPAPRQSPHLAGWRLEVLTPDGAAAASLVTDEQGLARVTLPAGDYRVRPLGPPGLADAQAVSVPAGGTARTVLRLHNVMP